MNHLRDLRSNKWADVPSGPGVYWWYFPRSAMQRFRIAEFCREGALNIRASPEGKVCLYHGMAKSLSQRVKWHAAQKLSLGALSSGFLSTFRFTLLALNDFDFLCGAADIDAFMDDLDIDWRPFPSVAGAFAAEAAELAGAFHYPLNIQSNRHPGLASFTLYLKATRKAYKERYLRAQGPSVERRQS